MKMLDAIDAFERYQRDILGRSENTIKNYKLDLVQFCKVAGLDGIEDVSRADAENFILWLANKGTAASTRCRKISAIQSLFKWAEDCGIVQKNAVGGLAKPKIPQKKVLAMSAEEVQKVLWVAKNRNQHHKDFFRNLTMIALLFASGLRRNELVNIKVGDVFLPDNALLVREGKGDKQRIVYYNDDAKALLSEWIVRHRKLYKHAENSEYLFVTEKSEKMNPATVNMVVNGLYEEAGIKEKGYGVHSTRRSFATAVYDATKDVVVVQNLLGHSNPQVTMRYIGVDEGSKKQAAQLVNF